MRVSSVSVAVSAAVSVAVSVAVAVTVAVTAVCAGVFIASFESEPVCGVVIVGRSIVDVVACKALIG